jgi:small subunit ribosomal protein S5
LVKGKIDPGTLDLSDRLIVNKRVTKVVKGGRTISFSALVVVGDGKGNVGIGLGKAHEVAEAIRKGKEDAKKHIIFIPRNQNDSIYHEVLGHFGASKVLLKPAREGTGVIAGGPVRAIMELAGVRNIITKCIGSSNKHNVVNAAMKGLSELRTPQDVARLRGKTLAEITGKKE